MTLTKLCSSFILCAALGVTSARRLVRNGTADNAALLSGTLKTYHKTVCDSENVTLSCPRGTSISIEMAQYEKNEDGKSMYSHTMFKNIYVYYMHNLHSRTLYARI